MGCPSKIDNCFDQFGVCLEDLTGEAAPDRNVPGSWGLTKCCTVPQPMHFECLLRWLEPRVVNDAEGNAEALNRRCPLCRGAVSRSSRRGMLSGKQKAS